MRQFSFGVLLICAMYGPIAAQQEIALPFTPTPIQVDGVLDEWELPIDIKHTSDLPYQNKVNCGLYWDVTYLYVAFKVSDYQLCVNESKDNNPRLYLSDAVEIYLDSKNDSQEKMDLNDYQLLISLTGDKTIFKGDKQQMQHGSQVPKDHEATNIIIHTKSVIYGSINNSTDIDSGYQVEIAIPWSAVGIIPEEGFLFKLDLCNDDIDTTGDIRSWPELFHPVSMNYINLRGKSDFGFPADWVSVRLTGSSNWKYSLLNTYHSSSLLLKLCLGALLLSLIIGLWYQNSRLRFYSNFPKRETTSVATLPDEKGQKTKIPELSPEINTLRRYIQDHMEEDIPIEHIASELNVSVRQLQRKMKTELDMTPKQFITIIKLEKAEQLLHNSPWTISEIAFKCGFADPSYFGAVFKKYFGKTPAEYRKDIL